MAVRFKIIVLPRPHPRKDHDDVASRMRCWRSWFFSGGYSAAADDEKVYEMLHPYGIKPVIQNR